ncbi:MAG TPA: PKD domain-containing protein, partial [Hydrogenophaga sp.]
MELACFCCFTARIYMTSKSPNRWALIGAASALTMALTACGGGESVDGASLGSGGTQTTSSANNVGPNSGSVPDAKLTSAELAEAETEAQLADQAQPLESVAPGSVAAKAAYTSGEVSRKAALVGVPAYRFYNSGTNAHFYTTSLAEADGLLANFLSPFRLEGPAFWVAGGSSAGLSPVYRFFNANSGVHFYTISDAERASLQANPTVFKYEGVAYYGSKVAGSGLVPLYRFYVPGKGFHFYTTSASERDSIRANLGSSYSYEGVGYYVLDSSTQGTAPSLGQTSQSVVAQLDATRISGTAPLAVQFDASGTTSSLGSQLPFHHVRYAFSFGDDRGQTWPASGLSKNLQSGGPLAAHVYDLPGTYQVRVRATDQAGG